MIKLRDAGYCNLKLLLIYLVIYGHWIEAGIWESTALMVQYRCIYLVHMPLFSFLTGLFLHTETGCIQLLRRTVPLYILLQTLAVLLSGGAVRPLTPYWHLWYLLSCGFWAGFGWLWLHFGKKQLAFPLLIASVLLACAAGYIPWLDRTLSGSRTLVFFPCFFSGLLCPADLDRRKLRPFGLVAGALAGIYLYFRGNALPVTFLYQAAPYGNVENGFLLRLLSYGLSTALGLFLLSWMPDRRLPFTKAGADTMPAYLLHAPLVWLLRQQDIPWLLCPLLSAALLYGIYKLTQWRGQLFGITERRDRPWLPFRRSTKNTQSRCTDSSCP